MLKRGVSLAAILALSPVVVPRAAMAFVAPEVMKGAPASVHVGIKTLRPRLAPAKRIPEGFKGTTRVKLSIDARSGAPRLLEGGILAQIGSFESLSTTESFEAAARAVVASHPELFGVTGQDLVLDTSATLIDDEVQLLKFRVQRDGLLVQDATVDFRFNRGRLVQIASLTFGEAAEPAPGQTVEASLAHVARASVPTMLETKAKALGEAFRVVETKAGYQLVRVAAFDVATDSDRFIVQVDAASGKVFEVRPTAFHLDGQATGQVYARYYAEPLVTRPYSDLALTHAGGTTLTGLDGRFTGAPAGTQPMLDGFTGPRVKLALRSGTKVTASGAASGASWNVDYVRSGTEPAESDTNVAQSMVFYHTNAMIQRAKAFIATPWLEAQLTANVNLTQTCNAHWDGSTINFYSSGGGCANTGLISDVVYHEWGHGLDHNTGGIEDGGFSEGFGDIMSLVMTQSPILGVGFRTDGTPVRELETDKIYPQDSGGGVHAEGLIIGSTFWDLFKALRDEQGEQKADELLSKYALKVIFTASRYTDVYDALLVIDDDNGNLEDGTPNYCLINKTFGAHGLAVADEACNLAGVDAIEVNDSAGGNGNGILEPGETATLWITARNSSANDLTGLSATLALSGDVGATVNDASLVWGTIAARSQGRSTDTAGVALDGAVACGTRLTANVAFTAGARRANVSRELLVGTLIGEPALGTTSGLPAAISDNSSTMAFVAVDGAQWDLDTIVQAAHLKLDVTHTYQGDLTVTLIAPDGTSRVVFTGSGATDDIHFDADITEQLAGVKGKGQWSVTVTDDANQDIGTFDAAELTLTPAAFECL